MNSILRIAEKIKVLIFIHIAEYRGIKILNLQFHAKIIPHYSSNYKLIKQLNIWKEKLLPF